MVKELLRILAAIHRYPVSTIIVASFVVQGSYLLWFGPVMSLDSQSYSRWAGYLLEYRFNYLQFFENVKFTIPTYFYSGFISIAAIAKIVLADKWAYGILGLNLIAYAATAGLITRIICNTTRDSNSALVGGGLYLMNFESFQWVRYVLSDTTFVVLVVTAYFVVFKYMLAGPEGKRYWYASLTIMFCIILMSYRPTAIPIVIVLVAIIVFSLTHPGGIKPTWLKKSIVGFLILGLGFATFVHAYYMQNVGQWPLNFGRGYIELIATYYAEGRVIDDRPELNLSNPTIYTDYLVIILTRIVYFFVFAIDAFSTRHIAYNLLTFPPIYLLGILFWVGQIVGSNVDKNERIRLVGVTSTAIIVLIVLFNSFLMIDYDWRYRVPAIPFMVILASFGFNTLLVWLKRIIPVRSD
jgi:hypothetical protein